MGATALSGGLHGALLVALLLGWRTVAPPSAQLDIPVSLAPALIPPPPAPKPAPTPSKPAASPKRAAATPTKQPAPKPSRPLPPAMVARRSPAPPAPISPPAVRVAARAPHASLDQLVDAQLAGASAEAGGGDGAGIGAGEGTGNGRGGGECDMASRVQAALRKDPLARAALHAAGGGRSILIWNGDWVQASTEDGKGLAAVREAITWEVAFAPAACRHQRVRGPVLLSLNDGSPQMQLGAGEWRWSDLLGLR